jgi:hypothetical protein
MLGRWRSIFCIAMSCAAFGTVLAAEPAPAPTSSRQLYDECFKQAEAKKLPEGKARLDFMSQCMQMKMPSGTVYN